MNIIDFLRKHDEAYEKGCPVISDTEYDLLKKGVKEQYPDHPYFSTVGSPATSKEVKLQYIMGSLDKVGPDAVKDWIIKHGTIVASEKLDGVSILVKWLDGIPVFGATRGDGTTGQDISDKIKYFVPEIPVKGIVILRGEATLTGTSHHTLGFKNRRNGVAGLLRRDDINIEHLKMIVPKFYEILYSKSAVVFEREWERFDYIQNTLKLRTPYYYIYDIGNADAFIHSLNEDLRCTKAENDYDIDGFVLAIDKSQRQNVKIPSNKIAYKVNEEAIKVKVTGIEWNLSKGGKIIPTVLLEPTEMGGATISRTSGFNAQFIQDNEIKEGTIIGLVLAGSIIPYITEVF